jgi:long-chain acyl-CoA synthetase
MGRAELRHGDSLKSSLVAIVVPDFEVLVPWATTHGKSTEPKTLCQDKDVCKMILDDMIVKGKENKLRPFEFVVAITLTENAFTVENDLLTPTFKLKRPQTRTAYNAQLEEMYKGRD